MLIKYIAIPIVVLGVLGFALHLNWWLVAGMGAACALLMLLGDWFIARSRRARHGNSPAAQPH
jgi:hypothetical protein